MSPSLFMQVVWIMISHLTTFVMYLFTKQKNGQKGDDIAHTTSGDVLCCLVRATILQSMLHWRDLRQGNKPCTYNCKVKLASYYNSKFINVPIKTKQVTNIIRIHARVLRSKTGVNPKEYTACSFRSGGAMTLSVGEYDKTVIMLMALWHSNTMLIYLHQSALPIYKKLASTMFNNDHHCFPANYFVHVVL